MSARLSVGALIGALLAAGPASAQNDPPDYDFDWVTIGKPGNRDTIPDEVPKDKDLAIGGVNYKYRIARTEVTVKQHFEFVQAFWPYWGGSYDDSSLVGFWIRNVGSQDKPQFKIMDGAESRPTEMSWHVAARFVNWLHNGKSSDPAAFEDGVYDTSTFGKDEDGYWHDQETHHPDARFWIPTLDEWTKAMHYDPDRYGSGQEGYWLRPDSGNEDLISDWPWNEGETGAGMDFDPGEGDPWLDVGAYPWTQSPWGLLDGSGGQIEWAEDFSSDHTSRLVKGTKQESQYPGIWDRIDRISGTAPEFAHGLRIASTVPNPGTCTALALSARACLRRRRA